MKGLRHRGPREVESGHEFTRKRLVEMETTLEKKMEESSVGIRKAWL